MYILAAMPLQLLGVLEEGGVEFHNTFFFFRLKKKNDNNFFLGAIILGKVVVPFPNIVIILPRTYRSYPVKKNPIGSAVSDTDKQTSYYFNLRTTKIIDYYFTHFVSFSVLTFDI